MAKDLISALGLFTPFSSLSSELLAKLKLLFSPFTLKPSESLNLNEIYLVIAGEISAGDNLPMTPSIFNVNWLFSKSVSPDAEEIKAISAIEGFKSTRADLEKIILESDEFRAVMMNYFADSLKKDKASKDLVVGIFDAKSYDKKYFNHLDSEYKALGLTVKYFDSRLGPTTIELAKTCKIIIIFVNDELSLELVDKLADFGVELVCLRSAGFNNVDIDRCDQKRLSVARVPKYSPHAVAEHAISLMLALNRRIVIASNKTKEGDFSLGTFMTGFDMYKKTVGVVGTGKIGRVLCEILIGFGCKVLAYDIRENDEMKGKGVEYVSLEEIWKKCDIVSLHSPLLPETKHMVNKDSIKMMKKGIMLINTSRGGLINTEDLVEGLKSGQIGFAGLDVYENESEYFFEDFSERVIQDDLLTRLTSFRNVIVTGKSVS